VISTFTQVPGAGSPDLAESLARAFGFRNVLVHARPPARRERNCT